MEVELTNKLALQLWWAMTWRLFLLIIVGSVVVGLVIGLVGVVIGLSEETAGLLGGLAGIPIGLAAFVFVVRRLNDKGFGVYRLAVMEK